MSGPYYINSIVDYLLRQQNAVRTTKMISDLMYKYPKFNSRDLQAHIARLQSKKFVESPKVMDLKDETIEISTIDHLRGIHKFHPKFPELNKYRKAIEIVINNVFQDPVLPGIIDIIKLQMLFSPGTFRLYLYNPYQTLFKIADLIYLSGPDYHMMHEIQEDQKKVYSDFIHLITYEMVGIKYYAFPPPNQMLECTMSLEEFIKLLYSFKITTDAPAHDQNTQCAELLIHTLAANISNTPDSKLNITEDQIYNSLFSKLMARSPTTLLEKMIYIKQLPDFVFTVAPHALFDYGYATDVFLGELTSIESVVKLTYSELMYRAERDPATEPIRCSDPIRSKAVAIQMACNYLLENFYPQNLIGWT